MRIWPIEDLVPMSLQQTFGTTVNLPHWKSLSRVIFLRCALNSSVLTKQGTGTDSCKSLSSFESGGAQRIDILSRGQLHRYSNPI